MAPIVYTPCDLHVPADPIRGQEAHGAHLAANRCFSEARMPLECSFIALVQSSLSYTASNADGAPEEGLFFLAWPSRLCPPFAVVEISSTSIPNKLKR